MSSEHRISWFKMRGQWGYDVECSCGWKTRTGGATRSYVQFEVDLHKWETK